MKKRSFVKDSPFGFLANESRDHRLFEAISAVAEALGIETYLVGGYVRDLFLGRPCKDMDFSCLGEGNGIRLADALRKKWQLHPSALSIFKRFGTAQLRYKGYVLEFVTARKESYQTHSRNPKVMPATFDDDLRRRDFTVNAMAVAMGPKNYGALVDPFSGVQAIKDAQLITPLDPSATFSDDPLRMLRAIRFAAQLNFTLTNPTFEGIKTNKERIRIVAPERIRDELNKIILSKKPSVGFKLLFDAGLLHVVFPEMAALQGVEVVNGHAHKDNFYHTLVVLDNVAEVSQDLYLRWAAILHDIAKPLTKRYEADHGWTFHGHEEKGAHMVKGLFGRFRLPKNRMAYVRKLVRLHLRPIALALESITDSALRRLLLEAGEDLNDLMMLCRADITSKNEARVQRYLKNFDRVEKKLQEVEEKDRIRNFQPPMTGDRIMKILHIPPSPLVGQAKGAIKDAILAGDIPNTAKAAHQYLLKWAHDKGIAVPK